MIRPILFLEGINSTWTTDIISKNFTGGDYFYGFSLAFYGFYGKLAVLPRS